MLDPVVRLRAESLMDARAVFARDPSPQFTRKEVLVALSNAAYFVLKSSNLSHEEVVEILRELRHEDEL